MTDFLTEIKNARIQFNAALSTQMGVNVARQRMMNILFNNCDKIIEAVGETDNLRKEVEDLSEALEAADLEYNELKKSMMPKDAVKKK